MSVVFHPELVKGISIDDKIRDCCFEGPLVQDKTFERWEIKMMICPKCHLAWRTFKDLNGLRCIWYAPSQIIARVLGENALTEEEKEDYKGIKGTWIEDLRLRPM